MRQLFPEVSLSLLLLTALWGHHYPVGVDLPQHAQLISILLKMNGEGPLEFERLYRLEPFTPYLLSYGATLLVAKVVGPLAAIKLLYTAAAAALWLGLRRWLAAIGGAPELAVLGLPAFFGFTHLWGFYSNCLALPLVFFYLVSVEKAVATPGWRATLALAGWGALLFFSHGITFGVCMIIAGLRALTVVRSRAASLTLGAHFLPLLLLVLTWLRSAPPASAGTKGAWFFTRDRLVTLLSGYFDPWPNAAWAAGTAAAIALFLAVARPKLNKHPAAWLAFLVPTTAFLVLPDTISATWLVATRLCVFVQVTALSLLAVRESTRPQLAWGAWAMAAVFLVVFNLRLAAFNDELHGLRALAARIPPQSDVFNLVPASDSRSRVFGRSMLGQVAAWVALEKDGFIDNDSAFYFQMPVRRRSRQFPEWFDFSLTQGDLPHATSVVRAHSPGALHVATEGTWHLFQRPPVMLGDLRVVRAAQEWGTLGINQSVTKLPLTIAGRTWPVGLGTHPRSLLRVRAVRALLLRGACGLDHGAAVHATARCLIWGDARRTVFDSGVMTRADEARPFEVSLREGEELVLEGVPEGPLDGTHLDWVFDPAP